VSAAADGSRADEVKTINPSDVCAGQGWFWVK